MRQAAAAGALALLWMLPGLFGHDPWKPDEAYTFGLVLHILKTGDWVVPTLAGEPFVEKPPLFFLTAALFAKLFGSVLPLHDAARVATLFYMSLAFACLGLTARRLYGAPAVPAAVLLLAGSVGLVDRGHQLITDTAQLAGFSLAVLGFALSLRRPVAGGLALGTGAGIAFLAKGLFIPGSLAVSALLLPVVSPAWRTRAYPQALTVATLCALPWLLAWPVALHARAPELFEQWLWGLNVGSFIGEESIAAKPSPFFYLWVLPWFALPSWPLAAWNVWRSRAAIRERPEIVLPLVLLAVPLAVLSVSTTGRELYAMPLLVPLCLLAAAALGSVTTRLGGRAWRAALWLFGLAASAAWLTWASLDMGWIPALQQALLQRQPAYAPRLSPEAVGLALAYTAAVAGLVWRERARPERLAVAWTATVALAWGLSLILLLRYLDTSKSYRAMTGEIARALSPGYICVASRGLGEPQRALLHYFAGVTTYRAESERRRSDCDVLLVQGFRERIAVPGEPWRLIWEGARPGDRKELYRLYEKR